MCLNLFRGRRLSLLLRVKILKLRLHHFQLACLNFNGTLICFSDSIPYKPNLRTVLCILLCKWPKEECVPVLSNFFFSVSLQLKNVTIHFVLNTFMQKNKQQQKQLRNKNKTKNKTAELGWESIFMFRFFTKGISKHLCRESASVSLKLMPLWATFMDLLSFPFILNLS